MTMAAIYAALIKKGMKTIDEVPEKIRSKVQAILLESENE
ncbi:uncharacterized protein BN645_01121 [Ruminococcus sp. CAG:403]|nr:uncharacterized protein BN645_01121 [Ruminococcus sp. CAG:403]